MTELELTLILTSLIGGVLGIKWRKDRIIERETRITLNKQGKFEEAMQTREENGSYYTRAAQNIKIGKEEEFAWWPFGPRSRA